MKHPSLEVVILFSLLLSILITSSARSVPTSHFRVKGKNGVALASQGAEGIARVPSLAPPPPKGNEHPDPPPSMNPGKNGGAEGIARASPFTPPSPKGNEHPDPPPFINP